MKIFNATVNIEQKCNQNVKNDYLIWLFMIFMIWIIRWLWFVKAIRIFINPYNSIEIEYEIIEFCDINHTLHIFIEQQKARVNLLFVNSRWIGWNCASLLKRSFNQFWTIEYIIIERDYQLRIIGIDIPFFLYFNRYSNSTSFDWNSLPKKICMHLRQNALFTKAPF